MNKEEQKIVLERFLEFHDIRMLPTARLAHYGRRYRAYFPDIANEVHPDGPWTSRPIERLADYVATLEPLDYQPRLDAENFHVAKKYKKQNRTKAFLNSREWRQLRYEILQERGARCECCGEDGSQARIEVDHIKPISKYWHLRLHKPNLQVLCRQCNQGKGARDETDWRR